MLNEAQETLTPYRFSGKSPAAGTLVLIGAALIGAVLVGAAYQALTNFVDIPVLMPAFAGLLVALIVKWGVTLGKCRSLPVVVAAALLAGILTYGVRLTLDSRQMRPALVQAVSRALVQRHGLPASAAPGEAERLLTPWRTLRLFLRVQADNGVTLTNSSSHSYSESSSGGTPSAGSTGGLVLSGVGYWLLLLAEAAAAGGTAAAVARRYILVEPFCETCGRWMRGTKVVKAAPRQAGEIIRCVQDRDWSSLLKIAPVGSVDSQNYASATVYRCPKCEAGTVSVFAQVGSNAKRLLHVELGPQTAEYLCQSSRTEAGNSGNI
jgi:predicted RNA-binding Zn-ribbon protein involved in translation (DUF1610 family)